MQKRRMVHFIGIGGIGTSALARWYLSEGYEVSGSDLEASEITDELIHEGVQIKIGEHSPHNIPHDTIQVIHTPAISTSNPERVAAEQAEIPIASYAEALGRIAKQYLTIAVSGSHGKSTTTALIATILIQAGLDPTVIIGTKVKEFAPLISVTHPSHTSSTLYQSGLNFRKGASPILLIEADEWSGSFLHYAPALAVVTNIDREHIDFYKTEAAVYDAFKQFLLGSIPGCTIVINGDDPTSKKLGEELLATYPDRFKNYIHFYSFTIPEAAVIKPKLLLPGNHMLSNALAAYTVAKTLKISDDHIITALSQFNGTWRRFEKVGTYHDAIVIADYAHHPTEIKATIAGCREYFGNKKLIVVFQPHHYERTKLLFDLFQTAFDQCDIVCLLDIYEVAGREHESRDATIHSFELAKRIAERGINARYVAHENQLSAVLSDEADRNAVIIMMGAGSIWKITKNLLA